MLGESPSKYLQRMLEGHVTSALYEVSVVDQALITYVSDMLVRFVFMDNVHRLRGLTGRRLVEVADMLKEADARQGTACREAHRHIGDYTLFWVGVFPEALRALQATDKRDHFIDYCAQGKRAYLVASTIPTDMPGHVPSELLERAAHDFERCAYALREARRGWEKERDEGTHGTDLLRSN